MWSKKDHSNKKEQHVQISELGKGMFVHPGNWSEAFWLKHRDNKRNFKIVGKCGEKYCNVFRPC